jgi:hypothetical protein
MGMKGGTEQVLLTLALGLRDGPVAGVASIVSF